MDVIDLLDKLVSIPSKSGSENLVSKFIESWVREHTDHKIEKVGDNVVVLVSGRNTGDCFIFNGHIDTVAPGEDKKWDSAPYKLTKRGQVLYGLGVSDMKGAIAVQMKLLEHYAINPPPCD